MEKIKVLHIITRLDPGGSATNTIETVARLDPKHFDAFLISGLTDDVDGSIERSLRQRGIPYKFFPDLQRQIDPWKDLKAFVELYRFISQNHFDIVHTHTSKAGILGRWAARCAGTKYIIHTPHGHVFYGYFGPFKTAFFIWLERCTALITDKIITLTNRGKQEHVDLKIAPASKFVAIYSGIEISSKPVFNSKDEKELFKKQWKVPQGSFVFGSAARLDPVKGISYLIKAAKQVVGKFPQCHLLLVGEGQERKQLEVQAKALGIKDHITFTGFQKEVRLFIECMDVFVLASLNEGMGRVILEAMTCEKPVIATKVGGVPELVEDGLNGFLVPAKDHQALAAAMIKFLDDPKLSGRMSREARMKVGEQFNIDNMVRDIEQLYWTVSPMIITIHQPQYLPWLGYFDKISRADIFILLDNVQFKKNEWQNRNRIRTPQGWQWLTVPVLHDFGTKINAMQINNLEPWRKKHLRAMELNYAQAPYFDLYYPCFREILEKEWGNLSEVNICLVGKIMELLGIKTRIVLASEYEATEHKTLRLVELCKHFNAKIYLSGEGGLNYLDVGQFKENNIDILVQKYEHPVYNQMWLTHVSSGFISHLSVIDLLFNCGPQSLSVLAAGAKRP